MTDQLAEASADSEPSASAAQSASRYQRWRERRHDRVSKWDRPPDPHDWRYFVGGLGKILITIGLLMFGFVAYQLWGTGIETARAQNQLENQFEQQIASKQTSTTTATTAPPATVPATTPPTTLPAIPDATVVPTLDTPTVPPPASAPPTTGAAPIEQNIPPIERGEALAKLEIPRMGKTGDSALFVVPGVALNDLKKGPGHYPDTPLPGQLGNASIAGHRTTYGEPFRHIDELQPGDEIFVTMLTGDRFVYEVASTEIVGPDDYYVVTTSDPTVAELTLTSCHPAYTARDRIAVHAFLKAEESAPAGAPSYYDLEANGNGEADAVVDNPVVEADDTTPSTGATLASVAVSAEATADQRSGLDTGGEASEPSSEQIAPSVTQPTGDVQDAFGDGWFHDRSAWPQIAIWGAALILIAIAVRKISRHFRHDSIGVLVGIIPFVVCLYFFYQNVNRLLPAGF